MKRLIVFLMILALVASLASCKSNKAPDREQKSEEISETKKVDESEDSAETEVESAVLNEDVSNAPITDDHIENDDYTPLLYKVTDSDGSCIWVFGSIHLGYPDMIPFPNYVTEAYNRSDALAVECDILESEENTDISTLMPFMYTDGTTIEDHISPELYEKAKALLEESPYGYVSTYDYMKPVLWWELLEYGFYDECGMKEKYGVDRNLLKMAKDEGKEILEIESVEFQTELMAGFDEELVILMLESVVEGLSEENCAEFEQSFVDMVDSWYRGNEELLTELSVTDTEGLTPREVALVEEYDRQMLYDRNIGMADFAIDALENDKEVFICVGAAHVVGSDGIIDILSDEGYEIEICK